jgi:bifunctional hydroxylase/dehydrase
MERVETDVIVVGAGPAGLMLAGELRLGGARVTVLERLAQPTGQSRGLGFTARAMEILDQRGLLPRFGPLEKSPLGHFGGVRFDYTVLPDAHFGARGVPQYKTEAVLEDWATQLGADLRRGWEVGALTDTGDGVEVVAAGPHGEQRLRASWLVGCDGGQSTVRRLAGFAFPGTPATREMYLADVVGGGIRPRFLGERNPRGMVMAAPLHDGVDRIIVCPQGTPVRERAETVGFAEVADAWERITGDSLAGRSAEWVSSFTDASRQAAEYRRGRVLLAGDAAHIHLPAGGQGLSTGVQDVANLGWKLAAVVQGWASADLLDTYDSERRPVGARLLMNTRAQNLVFLGGEESDPLRGLFAELIAVDDVKRHLAGLVSGLDVVYDMGGDEAAAGPLYGRRLPPRDLAGQDGRTTTTRLLDLAADPEVRAAADGWKDRVLLTSAAPAEPGALGGARALLVRPDGYVAWSGQPADRGAEGLDAALRRWFGAPAAG